MSFPTILILLSCNVISLRRVIENILKKSDSNALAGPFYFDRDSDNGEIPKGGMYLLVSGNELKTSEETECEQTLITTIGHQNKLATR